ncbi:MAG TPA: hypothetical protein VKU36_01865, partial [Candidatus Babeliales bacterium]|nr:hypothetical protein [Candidatus Babeliales bacterium]
VKNIHYIVTFLAIFLSSTIKANQFDFKRFEKFATDTGKKLPSSVKEYPYQSAVPARIISCLYTDPDKAARYVKHAQFYAKKNNRTWGTFINDNIIDHAVYPVVDTMVGAGMKQLNEVGIVHSVTENISKDNRKFLANNTQLIVSAGMVKLISIGSERGLSSITNQDYKNFAKSCTAQVGCDAADEYIIKPTVDAMVGVDSWTGWGLRGITNFFLAGYIIDKVSKY